MKKPMLDVFDDLPDDAEAAFVILEQEFRSEYQTEIERADNNSWADEARLKYACQIRAALEELEVGFEFDTPDFSDQHIDYNRFQTFRRDVKSLTTKIRIRASRAKNKHSVKLDLNTKSKLHQLLDRIKQTILELDEGDAKREALLRKVAALETEINRDRTRFEIVGALWIGLCDKAGAGFEKLEPARRWVDSFANLIAQAKSLEPEPPSLPKREPQARIGSASPRTDQSSTLVDDEIPF